MNPQSSDSELYIGKVTKERRRKIDSRLRMYVGDLFKDGESILFIKLNEDVYLVNSDKILGSGFVIDKRVHLGKNVAKTLNLSDGDYTAIEKGKEVKQELISNLRLVKVEFKD